MEQKGLGAEHLKRLYKLSDEALTHLLKNERIQAIGKLSMVVGFLEGYLGFPNPRDRKEESESSK